MIPPLLWELTGILGAAFIYLIFDTYPVVKSFKATLSTGSFYLFWLILSALNLVAYGLLRVSSGDKIRQLVGSELAGLTLILLATVGTVGILQSLTLKIADYKFVDVGKLIDNFRATVLADIARKAADIDRMLAIDVARRLANKYVAAELRVEYQTVMGSVGVGRTQAQIGGELNQLEHECKEAGTSFERAIAERIAQADPLHAGKLLK